MEGIITFPLIHNKKLSSHMKQLSEHINYSSHNIHYFGKEIIWLLIYVIRKDIETMILIKTYGFVKCITNKKF